MCSSISLINYHICTNDSISEPLWILKTDSSSKAVGGGAGMVLQSPKGLPIAHAVKFSFSILNNEAKYEAILFGL